MFQPFSLIFRYEDEEGLYIQINVFDEQKQQDDEMMVTSDGLDLNDHQQVFRAVFDQVGFYVAICILSTE